MRCFKCGRDNPDDALFCSGCGIVLTTTNRSSNQFEHELDKAFEDQLRIVRELGRTGMSHVFEAWDLSLDRRIAIKILPRDLSNDSEMVIRFKREAKTAASLTHPNIIPIHAVGSLQEIHYFTMPFLSGGSLDDQLKGLSSIEQAILIVKQVASALDYAHERGVIHRDIKPQNILFDSHGSPVLVDFGIAKALHSTKITNDRTFLGTPHYSSPEQARGLHVDARSDLYSLGVIFYQMVTGHLPFRSDDPLSVMYQHVHDKPKSPEKWRPELPTEISRIITKLLAKDPKHRVQSGRELIAELDGFSTLVHEATREIDSDYKKTPPPKGRRLVGSAGSRLRLLVLMLICALLTFYWLRGPSDSGSNHRLQPARATKSDSNSRRPAEELTGEPGQTRSEVLSQADVAFAIRSLKFVSLKGGEFKMGTRTQLQKDAWHVHRVIVADFEIATTEVTQAIWAAVMRDHPSCTTGLKNPIDNISFDEVETFLARIQGIAGYRYRLPTEAEWEYACRAGDKAIEEILPGSPIDAIAWYQDNSRDQSHPVASKDANAWGIFDMQGNLWEWCSDWYSADYYGNSPVLNPTGPESGRRRVVRGGAYNAKSAFCRSTNRFSWPPNESSCRIGFRLLRQPIEE